jgi:hypothetical protein
MHDKDDDGFTEFVSEVVSNGHLEGAAEGIAKKVIAEGIDSLSPRQLEVFETHVLDEFSSESCERCSSSIPWSEQYAAYHNGGYCGYCDHVSSKDD